MTRHVFSVVTPIMDGHRLMLEAVLLRIQQHQGANGIIDFSLENFPELHFASFVIYEDNTLVFENSVSIDPTCYLWRVASYIGQAGLTVDEIYAHCVGYGAARTPGERWEYLTRRGHFFKPQLRHVSTPQRSARSIVEDRDVREALEARVETDMLRQVPDAMQRPAPAVREYWNWELVKPYVTVAGLAALIGIELLLWKWLPRSGSNARPALTWGNALVVLDMLLLAAFGGNTVLSAWHTTPPAFRARAKAWLLLSLIALGVLWIERSASMGILLGTIAALGAVIAAAVVATRTQLTNERMAPVRAAATGVNARQLWDALRVAYPHDRYEREREGVLRTLWNWRYWVIIPLATWWLIAWGRAHDSYRLGAGLIVAFFFESWWITTLVGWPPFSWPSAAKARFVVHATAAGALVVLSLMVLRVPSCWFAIAVLIAWFALQALTIEAPECHVSSPTDAETARIREVIDQEDLGVQNHMALVANIGPSRLRAISLRIFLWSLDKIFYRALLPDLWRGKLFGIPTVHSAQWLLLPGGRYLFLSNYDQSFTTYLNDFGTQIPAGIQKIWGECLGNPGLKDVETFKLFVRKAMVPYQVWYRAYPDLSVRQIWNNEKIRIDLADDTINEETIVATLRRFGGSPKIVPGIVHAAR